MIGVKTMTKNRQNRGFVLTGSLMLLLIGMLVAGSFIFVSRQSHPAVIQWARYDQTLLAAQTAMEKIKTDLYHDFYIYHSAHQSWADLEWIVDNAAGYSTNNTSLGTLLGANILYVYSNAVITATVASGSIQQGASITEREVVVTCTVSAAMAGIIRTIEEEVRYTLSRSSVFDYAYFINNFGWFYGVNCVVNGDIRSNEDIELRSSDLVLNGNSYATGVNDINRPYQTWSWNTYKGNSYSDFFRPSYYVDPTKDSSATLYEFGFKVKKNSAGSDTFDGEKPLKVPNIGNLDDYKDYAAEQNGTIRIGGVLVANHVFSGTGPSGVTGAPDQGSLVLIGTTSKPIVIDGPVVVEGDVIIKGYYTGQGTIYAGRNVHIIGDLKAVSSSQWEHPDTVSNFKNTTAPDNLGKDFLGLCARGSIVIGNYLSSSFENSILNQGYIEPSFVGVHEVDAMDADLGYVSFTQNGTNYFDGDYTATFGEKCGTVATDGVARSFYESSLSDSKFSSLISDDWVSRIDAVIYNNHLTTGLLKDAMINGSIICRDEAMLLSGRAYMNWDARLGMDLFKPFLPPELEPADTIQWRELQL
jgi:hypothetical protein